MNDYSILMSVYQKECADYLQMAMDSIWKQTIPPNDFVLVCDGPLNKSLDEIIYDMGKKHPGVLHIIRLPKNQGLGNALNIGLHYCKNDLIARMDSDDISRPDRCKKQLEIFQNHPEISICSGIVEEFSDNPNQIGSLRIPPETHQEIISFAKRRCPFNHPCVMYRKSSVERAGGYQDFYLLEDYYLWIRMLKNGCIGYNIQQPLLWMRAGDGMYKRRSGWKFAKSQIALFQYMRNTGFISTLECYANDTMRIFSSLMPNAIRKYAYMILLRKGAT